MLRLLGSKKVLCDGLTRRDFLSVGGLGAFGITLADALRLESLQAATAPAKSGSFGKAKSCILLFPYGSPPQHETFDPKPGAPAEIQGQMKAIRTSVPGIEIGEGLPQVARLMDRLTVVRSMTHPYPVHAACYVLSGVPTYTPALELSPRAPEQWPFMGSVVDYVDSRRSGGALPEMPRNIGLPWPFGGKSEYPTLAGPYAAFLGQAYDPVWTEFDGKGTRIVPKLNDFQKQDVYDPFGGTTREGNFRLSAAGQPLDDVTPQRIGMRRSLLTQFDRSRAWLERSQRVRDFESHRQVAYSLVSTTKVRRALDVHREPDSTRDRYGMTLFGQGCLAARRLIEAGGRFVSVFWDPFGPFGGCCWDTHSNHYPRLKEYLLPVFDQSYSALILDLEERGLLDETLVACISEHGRTPHIDSKPKGAGRHHWSRVYSAVFAGGGIARGKIVGRSDAIGGDVADTPISPKDILATVFYLLGIDPHTMMADRLGRPLSISGDGKLRTELLA